MMDQPRTMLLPDITITDIVKPYAQYKKLRPASVLNYSRITKLYTARIGETHSCVSDISIFDAMKFREMVLETAKPVTWNNYNRHLRALFNFSIKFELRKDNPFDNLFVRADRIPPAEKVISLPKLQGVLQYLSTPASVLQPNWFWEIVVLTFIYTLIRRRQLVELIWEDIQFDQRCIRLRGDGNKNHRTRYIPIHPLLLPQLMELRDITASNFGKIGPNEQVFNVTRFNQRYSGDTMNVEQVSGFFNRLTTKTGVRISSHRMRHTSASLLLKNQLASEQNEPLSLRALQQLLGHQSISTTTIYMHPDMEDLKNLVGRLRLT